MSWHYKFVEFSRAMWLLCMALTAQLTVVSQRKTFHCKDSLVERPLVPHTPCEPACVWFPSHNVHPRQGTWDCVTGKTVAGAAPSLSILQCPGLVQSPTALQPTASHGSLCYSFRANFWELASAKGRTRAFERKAFLPTVTSIRHWLEQSETELFVSLKRE